MLGASSHLAGPLHGFPVTLCHMALGEFQFGAESGEGGPVGLFLGKHEAVEGVELAFLAEEHSSRFVIEADAFEDDAHGHFQN